MHEPLQVSKINIGKMLKLTPALSLFFSQSLAKIIFYFIWIVRNYYVSQGFVCLLVSISPKVVTDSNKMLKVEVYVQNEMGEREGFLMQRRHALSLLH